MAKKVAVVIQEDPRKTHRPVEALRIALGLTAGEHATTVILLGEAIRLLTDNFDTDDIIDLDILEKYLPSIEQLEVPFIVPTGCDLSTLRGNFRIQCQSDGEIASILESVDCALVF